jgi:hypothetical protein
MKKIIRLTESELMSLVKKVINESDPKVGTGKKPKGSDRRLYTDENPSDTVSVKFRTKQDIVDTLNKESFKSKSHARQSQIINLIHQRLRVALERAKDPEVKKRLRTAFEYIESKKEQSKMKTQRINKTIKEIVTDKKVICDNCGWSWDISDGGDDLYICHKCGNDNEPTVGMMFESKSNKYDKFITYCKRFLDLKDIPEIIYNNTSKFEKEHKSFGLYDQLKDQIIVSTHKRNVGDIMRTIAHELVHYQQKTLHRKGKSSAGSKHENEANAVAGEIVRKYRQKHPEIFS